MPHKRNGFLTFCFSCLPGAGQMFLGFTKTGVSLMTIFFSLVAAVSWLGLDAILFLLPVVWFYAFFDAMNKNSLPEEEFEKLQDDYIFFGFMDEFGTFFKGRYQKIVLAVILIVIGLHMLFTNGIEILSLAGIDISYEVYRIIFDFIPQTVIGLLIIIAGVYLIAGKKKVLEQEMISGQSGQEAVRGESEEGKEEQMSEEGDALWSKDE